MPTPAPGRNSATFPITVLITKRDINKPASDRLPRPHVVALKPQKLALVNSGKSFMPKFALLNVRSLSGKSFLINDLICSNKLDFLFLTETWLDQTNCDTVLIESAPPDFEFLNATRPSKKGGGIAFLFKALFQYKHVIW